MTNVAISALPAATAAASTDILPIVQGGTTKKLTNALLFASATGIPLATAGTGALPAANGGTGQSSYAVGDILYASTTTALSKLPDVAVGSVFVSGGVGAAPAYSATPTVTSLTATTSLTSPIHNSGTTLSLQTGGVTGLYIDAAQNVLAGSTTSLIGGGGSIQAVGPSTTRGYLVMGRTTAATSGVCGSLIAYNATNLIASIDFQSNGANNSGFIQTFTYSAGSAVQGPFVNTGGTSWTTASDENLKDIIEPIENGVEKLSSLRSVIGKFKTDHDDVRRIFLIAQDVQKVLPEAICTDSNGYLGLNYQDLIPVLVKAIQELSTEVKTLKAKIGA